ALAGERGAGRGRGDGDDLFKELARQRPRARKPGRGLAEDLAVGLHRRPLLPEQRDDLAELGGDLRMGFLDGGLVAAAEQTAGDLVELLLRRARAELGQRVDEIAPAAGHRFVEQFVIARQRGDAELAHGQDRARGGVRPAGRGLWALRRPCRLFTCAHPATPTWYGGASSRAGANGFPRRFASRIPAMRKHHGPARPPKLTL